MLDFKLLVAAMIDVLIRDAIERGVSIDSIFQAIGAESLELAARIHLHHGGSDTCFLGMAQDLLAAVRTGAPDQ
jgi:hypothetical protein